MLCSIHIEHPVAASCLIKRPTFCLAVLQSADALTAFWPPMEDDNINTYRRQELDIFL